MRSLFKCDPTMFCYVLDWFSDCRPKNKLAVLEWYDRISASWLCHHKWNNRIYLSTSLVPNWRISCFVSIRRGVATWDPNQNCSKPGWSLDFFLEILCVHPLSLDDEAVCAFHKRSNRASFQLSTLPCLCFFLWEGDPLSVNENPAVLNFSTCGPIYVYLKIKPGLGSISNLL